MDEGTGRAMNFGECGGDFAALRDRRAGALGPPRERPHRGE